MKRTIKDYILLGLKGMGMGAADVVPGVSGGTIALISGIYEELINSIKSVNAETIKLLFQFKLKEFWEKVNGNFLASVFAGIGLSVFSLAKILKVALATYPVLVWSFFFGLIVASAILVAKTIDKWKAGNAVGLIVGTAIAFLITEITPAETTNAYWFLFLSGALAICAMILPGISGAFILLLLGKYQYAISALTELKLDVIVVIGAGAVVGLMSFSRLLSWLLEKYHNLTISVLAGFMIGSLNKVWPWKNTLEWRINSHGDQVPLDQVNVSPFTYADSSGEPSFIFGAIALAVFGFAFIYIVEFIADKLKTSK